MPLRRCCRMRRARRCGQPQATCGAGSASGGATSRCTAAAWRRCGRAPLSAPSRQARTAPEDVDLSWHVTLSCFSTCCGDYMQSIIEQALIINGSTSSCEGQQALRCHKETGSSCSLAQYNHTLSSVIVACFLNLCYT